ncbi:uncharacterized protein BCR38DRAFT_5816 [Pseudomassariella vexata]|uniref:Uncharacterized protein n=1 Tax=Pseudomassariella vexata TaxID=1141098 RepID=A0A1Y2EIT4_9PEZI|nr:uncharacterized protein BCR38DRAFT_5816 [Pseudomassariella vexata]ORY71224.1 hypothetical protein BCR38DRAFT_5816 [Pseudomassariella vexata]
MAGRSRKEPRPCPSVCLQKYKAPWRYSVHTKQTPLSRPSRWPKVHGAMVIDESGMCQDCVNMVGLLQRARCEMRIGYRRCFALHKMPERVPPYVSQGPCQGHGPDIFFPFEQISLEHRCSLQRLVDSQRQSRSTNPIGSRRKGPEVPSADWPVTGRIKPKAPSRPMFGSSYRPVSTTCLPSC